LLCNPYGTDVFFGKLPMVRRTLICKRCNFNRCVSATNF
jgi:hypothetical protein